MQSILLRIYRLEHSNVNYVDYTIIVVPSHTLGK